MRPGSARASGDCGRGHSRVPSGWRTGHHSDPLAEARKGDEAHRPERSGGRFLSVEAEKRFRSLLKELRPLFKEKGFRASGQNFIWSQLNAG